MKRYAGHKSGFVVVRYESLRSIRLFREFLFPFPAFFSHALIFLGTVDFLLSLLQFLQNFLKIAIHFYLNIMEKLFLYAGDFFLRYGFDRGHGPGDFSKLSPQIFRMPSVKETKCLYVLLLVEENLAVFATPLLEIAGDMDLRFCDEFRPDFMKNYAIPGLEGRDFEFRIVAGFYFPATQPQNLTTIWSHAVAKLPFCHIDRGFCFCYLCTDDP